MIRTYITNIPKNNTVCSANEGGLLAELFGVLDRAKLLDHYDSVAGVDSQPSSANGNTNFTCDIQNGIFEAQTVEQHQALINHLHMLESCGRLKPKTNTNPNQETPTPVVAPSKTSTEVISKEDLMEELIKEIKAHYHSGIPLDLPSALHLYCTFSNREPTDDETSRVKILDVYLGSRQIHEYKYPDFIRYQNEKIKELSARTVDERLALARRIYAKLIERGAYNSENPLQNWKPSISAHKRKSKAAEDIACIDRVVSVYGSTEFSKFGESHKSYYLIVSTAIVTGMRISSICGLMSNDLLVTLDGIPVISVARDKTSAGKRSVPVPRILFDTLKLHLELNNGFGIKCRGKKGYSDAIKDLSDEFFSLNSGFGKKLLNPHGLRAALNNYLMESQIDEAYRCTLLGHQITNPNNKYYAKPVSPPILVAGLKGIQEKILSGLKFDPALIFDNCEQNSIIKNLLTIQT